MAFTPKPGYGQLFKNARKKQPNHPDFTGQINYEGTVIELAGWRKQGTNGTFISLSVKSPESRGGLAKIGGEDADIDF